jgi:hypothetical protein
MNPRIEVHKKFNQNSHFLHKSVENLSFAFSSNHNPNDWAFFYFYYRHLISCPFSDWLSVSKSWR